ncbi:MaoC/PaaZ C-terminal domain-containing protein [Magnetococcus sp. PR-3]|uniref:MaoC/PaaZ C-terminal domain-containing protein n=1 Tax=Magnetococcus sp. PR-3 TaxID=3120355 RepID=UPI002FCDF8E6
MNFTQDHQQAFAQLSGDYNPMHVDTIAARRTPFGQVVVHGMHLVFVLLEDLAQQGKLPPLAAIEAHFSQPVFIQDPVRVAPMVQEGERLKLQLVDDGGPRMSLWITPGDHGSDPLPHAPAHVSMPQQPLFNQCKDQTGSVPLPVDQPQLQALFPALGVYHDPQALAVLLGLTQLVGMVCPGLHSLFSGFKLQRQAQATHSTQLRYRVKRASSPRAPIKMEVEGGVMQGAVQAFFRPPPVEQPSAQAMVERYGHQAYVGTHALVLGGARGLGEVAAKLIAAGGGQVTITYAHGQEDAQRVAQEITQAGGCCDLLKWDVCHPPQDLNPHYSHLYYFATPPIGRGVAHGLVDAQRLAYFEQFYVHGFLQTLERLVRTDGEPLQVFYPSTIYVTDVPKGLVEYAMAKGAGEALCHYLNQHDKRFHIQLPRLPKLHTDQNMSLLGPAPQPPLEVIQPWVATMHGL